MGEQVFKIRCVFVSIVQDCEIHRMKQFTGNVIRYTYDAILTLISFEINTDSNIAYPDIDRWGTRHGTYLCRHVDNAYVLNATLYGTTFRKRKINIRNKIVARSGAQK